MAIKLRLLQTYDCAHEAEFLMLEKRFVALERRHKGFPKGKRFKPIASALPVNTLIWEAMFDSLEDARKALDFFSGNAEHEKLARKQRKYFKDVRIEFLEEM